MRNLEELQDFINQVGVKKASLNFNSLFILGLLAGVYIGLGAVFFTTVTAYGGHTGLIKIVGGLAFSLGLILVVFAGAELFTGNNLMIYSYANKNIGIKGIIKNWSIVYFGNFVGSLLLVGLVFFSKQFLQDDFAIGAHSLNIAIKKMNFDFFTVFVRGVLCNILVCLAVWLTMVFKSTSGKIIGILYPITAFVAVGYEHSVANMFFIPMGIVLKNFAPTEMISQLGMSETSLLGLEIIPFFLNNLIPVTLGNIVGGSLFVGLLYNFAHKNVLRK